MKQGLGTQLRHLIELMDGAVAQSYEDIGLNYRPRYTPIVKALIDLEECTISELADHAGITQPAATQTIKLMVKADLINLSVSPQDSRQRLVTLSSYGKSIVPQLQSCWKATNQAAKQLEKELGFVLSEQLGLVINALSKKSFEERIREARKANQ